MTGDYKKYNRNMNLFLNSQMKDTSAPLFTRMTQIEGYIVKKKKQPANTGNCAPLLT